MSGDKIIQKIEEEAKQDAAAIGAAAQEKARKEKEQILAKAQEQVREIQAKSQVDAKEAAGRLQLIAELQSRKENLASKRKVLQEAFDRAAEQLGNMNGRQRQFAIGFIGTINHYLILKFEEGSEKGLTTEEINAVVRQFMYGIFS